MVPSSVINAWEALQETQRVAITRACAKKQPLIFARWTEAAGLKKFRQESLVHRKAGSAPRLDAVLFKAEEGQLASDLLVFYFTEMAPAINEECLALLQGVEDENAQGKLKVYAQIANKHRTSPLIRLYMTTLLWVEEFDEAEIETVDTLAAELAATGDN